MADKRKAVAEREASELVEIGDRLTLIAGQAGHPLAGEVLVEVTMWSSACRPVDPEAAACLPCLPLPLVEPLQADKLQPVLLALFVLPTHRGQTADSVRLNPLLLGDYLDDHMLPRSVLGEAHPT